LIGVTIKIMVIIIQAAEELGRKYTKSRTSFEGTQKSLGIDPGIRI
jgi:hypothetical protein